MADYSSAVSLSSSPGHRAESFPDIDSDFDDPNDPDNHFAYEHHVLQESDGSSDDESEGGLFVPPARSASPASVITLSASEQGEHRTDSEAEPDVLGHEQEDIDLDLESELERELEAENVGIDLLSSDEDDADPDYGDRDNLALRAPYGPGFLQFLDGLHGGIDDFDDLDDDLFGDDFDDDDEDLDHLAAALDEQHRLSPHYHHHHHHHHLHHFHHPRLSPVHPDRHSPIVRGVNPLQNFGPHLNFLPPHLHNHPQRAGSSSPVSLHQRGRMDRSSRARNGAAGQMDELVGVEMGRQAIGGHNLRAGAGRAQQNQQPPHAQPDFIDLTGDDEEIEFLGGSQNARRQQSQRRDNVPGLNRSDSNYIGGQPVIDLTSDSPDEEQMVNRANAGSTPGVRNRPHRHHPPRMDRRSPRRIPANNVQANPQGMFGLFANALGNVIGNFGYPRDDDVIALDAAPRAAILPDMGPWRHLPMGGHGDIHLNYQMHPFPHHGGGPGGPPKPVHEPPATARDGFTRDTGEEQVLVCPSCDNELAYDPDDEDDNGPPTKKARTKKDKAEHHFWAVKECGHVYCRRCYDNRKPTAKSPRVGFMPSLENPKKIICAVDGCQSDVSNKTAWVGLFL
ncbi:hypothetical protein BJ170DRAFT_368624 [Xylariales sp. AK1849]|nr:hypothetical protein BJ170DRAFT_368624 [Xylariales sp. AK1849]